MELNVKVTAKAATLTLVPVKKGSNNLNADAGTNDRVGSSPASCTFYPKSHALTPFPSGIAAPVEATLSHLSTMIQFLKAHLFGGENTAPVASFGQELYPLLSGTLLPFGTQAATCSATGSPILAVRGGRGGFKRGAKSARPVSRGKKRNVRALPASWPRCPLLLAALVENLLSVAVSFAVDEHARVAKAAAAFEAKLVDSGFVKEEQAQELRSYVADVDVNRVNRQRQNLLVKAREILLRANNNVVTVEQATEKVSLFDREKLAAAGIGMQEGGGGGRATERALHRLSSPAASCFSPAEVDQTMLQSVYALPKMNVSVSAKEFIDLVQCTLSAMRKAKQELYVLGRMVAVMVFVCGMRTGRHNLTQRRAGVLPSHCPAPCKCTLGFATAWICSALSSPWRARSCLRPVGVPAASLVVVCG